MFARKLIELGGGGGHDGHVTNGRMTSVLVALLLGDARRKV